ncbi:DUF3173 family protein [Streptococcus agalactiae]|uniref:Domain of uncharacterized function (DUF3173) n=1 Tax=Streptococcus agalactiae TaxID=1311 RepID=A0AB74H2N3_STRAG|nr:DUF3173 family protein [Streptococcus agalactiae]EPV86459.1 hypothetical protein SAG0014_04365 [Streptococcus agalactiae FSL S3-586]KLL27990.1 hypothetical protein WA01_07525 [Streptococcus agalactiae]MDK6300019.1 DUF3173 family protein [Streptococcus agalactiae]PWT19491.1 DUF3173 domain-containing protein [Streptococcus agalactiae]QHO94261.1 hypothetical protein C2E46_10845 [Streptococcus agalactiae]
MRDTVNKQDLLKEMSAYKAGKVIKMAKEKLIEDGFTIYEKQRNIEIPQEYIYKILGRYIENG